MKKLFITLTVLAFATGAFAQSASFSITDNGLYGGTDTSGTFTSSQTFVLSLYGSFTGIPAGFMTDGFSLFLEAPTTSGFNTKIQATGATYFQYTSATSMFPAPFTTTSGGPDPGFLSTKDIGATTNSPSEATGNYTNVHLADYTFTLTGAPTGTYTLMSTTQSEISYNDGTNFLFANAPQISYLITVAPAAVPEPSTYLAGIAAAGLIGFTMLRRRRAGNVA